MYATCTYAYTSRTALTCWFDWHGFGYVETSCSRDNCKTYGGLPENGWFFTTPGPEFYPKFCHPKPDTAAFQRNPVVIATQSPKICGFSGHLARPPTNFTATYMRGGWSVDQPTSTSNKFVFVVQKAVHVAWVVYTSRLRDNKPLLWTRLEFWWSCTGNQA